MAMALLLGYHAHSHAQHAAAHTGKLNLDPVEPYQMEVTFNKTSHLIFPAAIRYVDLGSEYLIAGKADDAENVLRVKSSIRDFEEETNFSVITDDGRFYNFNVSYNPCPSTLNYHLLTMRKRGDIGNDVLFEELGDSPPSLVGKLFETIHENDKRNVRHICSKSYGIRFLLKGIYIQNDKFYFDIELRNKSNVGFQIDFVNFKVVDRKVAKRTVVQEKPMVPLRVYKQLDGVEGNATGKNVFLLDQFTITDDKVLLIEIFEKNGGRHQVLWVENADLVSAKLFDDLHFKD